MPRGARIIAGLSGPVRQTSLLLRWRLLGRRDRSPDCVDRDAAFRINLMTYSTFSLAAGDAKLPVYSGFSVLPDLRDGESALISVPAGGVSRIVSFAKIFCGLPCRVAAPIVTVS